MHSFHFQPYNFVSPKKINQMKTRIQFALAAAAFAFTTSSAMAQISNGDFSNATKAPRTFNQINLASGWSNANGGTADFYHKNASKCSNMGTSENRLGQQAAFKGDGYAGIIAYQNDKSSGFSLSDMAVVETNGYGKYGEYITTKLDKSLTAGKTYKVTYYVSLAENSGYVVSGFGAYLTSDAMNQTSNAYIMATPQVSTKTVADSKSEWTKISGTFKATGNESYVTIGVFNGPASTKSVSEGNGVNGIRAYYFVDGVSIEEGVSEKDTDKDGLTDAMEASFGTNPNNPDTDGDGLNDGEEINGVDSPSTTAVATMKSNAKDACDPLKNGPDCDADGDGLTNAQEANMGTNPNNPDTDGDGVKDNADNCPTVPGKDNGCPENAEPDSDRDGLTDAEEKELGTDPNNPDTDGDTVGDKADHCPLVAGTVAAKGCALDEALLEEIKSASEHIYFNSGKSTIKAESFPDLDKLAAIFKEHPEVKASIEGHTDSQGNDQMNLDLSKARAKAVKDYLIKKGVDADHLTSEGFGETRPVATNDTAEGRAKNRRVIVQTSLYKVKN